MRGYGGRCLEEMFRYWKYGGDRLGWGGRGCVYGGERLEDSKEVVM